MAWPVLAAPVDYSRDILPLLSDKCYHCHGPDEKARKAKLRLDTRDGAFAKRKDGTSVIVPGRSSESELVQRISTTNQDDKMPPPDSNRTLTPQQVQLLTRWVDEGAKWGMHWAFVAPVRPAIPSITNQSWTVRNPIDAFVLAKLQKQGISPSPTASREALLRRVTLDLTGLPPTIQEIDNFLRDKSSNAYERVVDRLLASPRYGERMATDWLDLARYADTHGYQMDRFRPMWPYRDWVIKAFNQNLPYNEFVTWQLAGDLLPHATKEQRLATAFNRLHNQNEEGGIVEEEYRVAYVVDRVDTFGTAFLGLTMECTRCHDHKYDPLTQRDFYSLFSFFQNIDESGQTSYFTDSMPVPTLLLSTDEEDAKLKQLRQAIADKQAELKSLREERSPAFEAWLHLQRTNMLVAGRAPSPGASTNFPTTASSLLAHFSFDEIISNKVTNLANPANFARAQEGPALVDGKFGKAAQLSGENGFTFPKIGHFSRVDSFTLALWLKTPAHAPRLVVAHHSKAPIDAGSRGYELLLEDGKIAFGLHHMWPRNSLKVLSDDAIPTNEWTHVAVTYDGSSRAAGVRLFINGKEVSKEIVRDGLFKDITYSGGEPDLAIGYRFRDNGFKGGAVDDFEVFGRALTGIEVAARANLTDADVAWTASNESLNPRQRQWLREYYFATVDETALKTVEALHQLRREEAALVNPISEAMVMEEMPKPKPAFILKRGAYDAHGEQVSADTPHSLPPFPAGAPRNRLGLAEWLLAPDHPLMARVTANRAWQIMFGRGIVETSDNFGSQGAQPTNQELLDWLAREFVEPTFPGAKAWDMKRLLKLIAMSATYRQSSKASPDLLAHDPHNDLLARGPSGRLTAEMIRDSALAISGLLAERLGGPSVKPYQPEGIWDIAMGKPHYDHEHGANLYRRSLYTFWKRTVPPPAMVTFDAADRSYCTARRQSTSTPLQALALLNDVQLVEAARMAGQRMLKEGGPTLRQQIEWIFRIVTSCKASPKELAILERLYSEQDQLYTNDPDSARRLLRAGEAKADETLPAHAAAAATVLAEALLNDHAYIWKR